MRTKGFGLLEVLITLVIMSVGLLALATLNMTSYRQALDAELRQTAVFLAEDLKNRMGMNKVEARIGAGSTYNDPGGAKGANNASCSSASNCTTAQIAALDLYQVYNLAKKLPSGTLKVCLDNTGSKACNGAMNGNIAFYNINITWSNGNATESLQASIAP